MKKFRFLNAEHKNVNDVKERLLEITLDIYVYLSYSTQPLADEKAIRKNLEEYRGWMSSLAQKTEESSEDESEKDLAARLSGFADFLSHTEILGDPLKSRDDIAEQVVMKVSEISAGAESRWCTPKTLSDYFEFAKKCYYKRMRKSSTPTTL